MGHWCHLSQLVREKLKMWMKMRPGWFPSLGSSLPGPSWPCPATQRWCSSSRSKTWPWYKQKSRLGIRTQNWLLHWHQMTWTLKTRSLQWGWYSWHVLTEEVSMKWTKGASYWTTKLLFQAKMCLKSISNV